MSEFSRVGNAKDFLGIGLKYPIQINRKGALELSPYEEDIADSIRIILSTPKGERVMRPDFGCDISKFIFDNNNTSIINRIKYTVLEALTIWETRIKVNNIEVVTDKLNEGKLLINIHYNISSTNNRYNIVYPFYFKEGG